MAAARQLTEPLYGFSAHSKNPRKAHLFVLKDRRFREDPTGHQSIIFHATLNAYNKKEKKTTNELGRETVNSATANTMIIVDQLVPTRGKVLRVIQEKMTGVEETKEKKIAEGFKTFLDIVVPIDPGGKILVDPGSKILKETMSGARDLVNGELPTEIEFLDETGKIVQKKMPQERLPEKMGDNLETYDTTKKNVEEAIQNAKVRSEYENSYNIIDILTTK